MKVQTWDRSLNRSPSVCKELKHTHPNDMGLFLLTYKMHTDNVTQTQPAARITEIGITLGLADWDICAKWLQGSAEAAAVDWVSLWVSGVCLERHLAFKSNCGEIAQLKPPGATMLQHE